MKFKLVTSIIISTLAFTAYIQASTTKLISVPSTKMGKEIKVNIILPDSYDKNSLPVLYLLHGATGSCMDWPKNTNIGDLADEYNIIVVCPDGTKFGWYFDSPIEPDSQYETFVADELVKYIDKNYKTLTSRNFKAISGLSMGGHGALFLAMRHKDTFGVVGSQSGAVDITPYPNEWEIKKKIGEYSQNKELWESLSVINIAKNLKDKELAIYIDCGTSDFFIEINRNLHKQLLNDKITHTYTEHPGKHDWNYWRNSIKYQMLFIHENFQEAVGCISH